MPTALNSKEMDSQERADQKQETVGVNSKGIGSQERAEHQQGTAGDTQQGYEKPPEDETAEDRQHISENPPEDETASIDERIIQQWSEKAHTKSIRALQPCFSLIMNGNMAVLKPDCFGGTNSLPKKLEKQTDWLSRNYLMFAHIDPKQRVEGRIDLVLRKDGLQEESPANMGKLAVRLKEVFSVSCLGKY